MSLVQLRVSAPQPAAPIKRKALFEGRELGAFRFGSKLERSIVRKVGSAVADFDLLADGDRVMVCISGGKDSYAMLDALRVLARRSPVSYQLVAVNVDQGWPDYDTVQIEEHLRREGVEYHMAKATYAEVVEAKLRPGQAPCALCSRFRRAYLYDLAPRLGCNKIALGHHADDAIETLYLNMLFSGRMAAMPAKLRSDDERNTVIRPLIYVSEEETVAFAAERRYPIVRCGCPSCGLPDQKRQVVKRLLGAIEGEHPGAKRHMLAALKNVRASHLLDPSLTRAVSDGEGEGPDVETLQDL